jgi:hypothetical protein
MSKPHRFRSIDFKGIAREAQCHNLAVLSRLLPDGKVDKGEYVALNPRRPDRHRGSFRINLATGRWADFALDDAAARGGDLTSLAAYLFNIKQSEAARGLMRMLGMEARQ